MAHHTIGTELDPRLNQDDEYCSQCGDYCGKGSDVVGTEDLWYCKACLAKLDEDGPQNDDWLEAERLAPDPGVAMEEARKLK
jgi:hypothetical protein